MGQSWVARSLEQPLLQIRAQVKKSHLVLHSGIDHTLFSVTIRPWEGFVSVPSGLGASGSGTLLLGPAVIISEPVLLEVLA